ncbi:9868_t:CDS:2, partial [Dentiscutata heterogama]
WARSLGDIYGVHMGQQYWIIFTSDKVVGDLLQKRGGKCSTRIPSYNIHDVLTRGRNIISCPYNERYKMIISIMYEILQRNVKKKFKLLDDEFRILMQNLYKASVKTEDAFYPKYYFQLASLNIISILCSNKRKKWLPDNNLYNKLIENRDIVEAFYRKLINEVMDDKEKKPCFIRDLLHKKDEEVLDELDVIYITSSMFAAGSDTISASLTWLTAALANNPH